MSVATGAIPREEDAGALVLRYQQRMRAELLKKAADESAWGPRWRRGAATATKESGGGAPTLAERMVGVAQTLTDSRQFVTSGPVLALVTAATSVCLLLGVPGMLSWVGLLGLGLVVVVGVARPVRGVALGLTALTAIGQVAAIILDTPDVILPGLAGALGVIVTGLAADRYGLACRQEQDERAADKRVIDEMQPVDEDAGVLRWTHASLLFDRELARAHRYGHPLTLLRVEVEQWDMVRANLGPKETGEVLAEVGALLVSSSRVVDVVAYHGEGKFDLLLPDTAELGAVVVARRVTSHISEHPGVTLRVGVAPVVGQDGSIDDLLQQGADAASAASLAERPFAVYGVEMASLPVAGRRSTTTRIRRRPPTEAVTPTEADHR
jgi:diguanylate cyclase (GGDEF)-like protein